MAQKTEIEIQITEKLILFLVLFSFLLVIFYLNLKVTLNTPISFGDEGFHSHVAYLFSNLEYPIWNTYSGNKLRYNSFSRPPLWNILEGSILLLLRRSEIVIRTLTPFITFLLGISVFVLVKKLWNEKIAFFSSILSVSFPSIVTYSVLFYTDVLFTFYFTLFFLTFLIWKKKRTEKYLYLSSIFGGLAFLTKRPGLFVVPFIGAVLVYEILRRRNLKTIVPYLKFIGIFSLVIMGFLLRSIHYYGTPYCGIPLVEKYLNRVFKNKRCYVDLWEDKHSFSGRTEKIGSEASVFSFGITNYLSFAYGNLWLFLIGVFSGFYILFKVEKHLSAYILFFIIGLTLILSVSTSRAEDTARYTLGWAPSLAIISSFFFAQFYEFLKNSWKRIGVVFSITFLFLILYLAFVNFESKNKTMEYVKRFSKSFFDACEWVRNNPDKVPENSRLYTIWAYRALYNCKRNSGGQVADIAFSRNLTETLELLKKFGYTHIFIQKFSIDPQNKHLVEKYDLEFVNFLENNPSAFIKIYENGPSIQECYYYWIRGYPCDGNIIYKINYTL